MKTTDEVLKFTRTISFKFILIGILSLFLLIPSAWIRGLVIERQKRSLEVVKEISSSWGEAQYFTGPVLTIPYTRYIEKDGKINIQKEYAHFLPSELSISGEIDPVIRYRGIYKVAVYNTLLKTDAIFEKPDLESLGIDPANTDLKNAYISVGISDMRGIKNDVVVNWMNKSLQVYPGIPERDIISSGFHSMADLDTSELPDKIPFSVSISLNGSNSLNFYPIGKTTKVNINSSWSDPAFEGNFLPNERNITDAGFQASWMVTHLNRNYPQSWINNGYKIEGSDFGVGLFLPVSHYQKSERSAKYALMFIGLTFLIFLLIEILNRKRLHPVQYLLTGLSLSVFYSLLVSLSE